MKRLKIFGDILFVATLISPIVSFALASAIGEAEIFGVVGIVRYSWIMWLFIPLGILSIIFAIKLKRSNQQYKKNYIVALVCIPLLILWGSFRFVFPNISYDVAKIAIVEKKTDIELPNPNQVKLATNYFDDHDVTYLKIVDEESKNAFEKEIATNALWKTKLHTTFKSVLPFDIQIEVDRFDCFVFYNSTLGEYNVYPLQGEYECVLLAYDYELGRMMIVDNLQTVWE